MLAAVAYGDALGARYEGLHLRLPPQAVRIGRGPQFWVRAGRWTDDTDMALGILLALNQAGGCDDVDRFRQVVLDNWLRWHRHGFSLGTGVSTYRALRAVSKLAHADVPTAVATAARLFHRPGSGGGNGAVMRTAPLALAAPGAPERVYRLAHSVAELTHPDRRAQEAAGVWTVLVERALAGQGLCTGMAADLTGDPGFWEGRLRAPNRPGRNGPRGWAPTSVADVLWTVRRALTEGGDPDTVVMRAARCAAGRPQDPDTHASMAASLTAALTGGTPPGHDLARVHGGAWTGHTWTAHDLADLANDQTI